MYELLGSGISNIAVYGPLKTLNDSCKWGGNASLLAASSSLLEGEAAGP